VILDQRGISANLEVAVPDPRIRAADADRDRVVDQLREHHAAGRLDVEEHHERMERALSAKTFGDLDALMADLPRIDHQPRPAVVSRTRNLSSRNRNLSSVAPKMAFAAVVLAGYVVSGALTGFWWIPAWLLILVIVAKARRRVPH
jgi:Domain of unknown function (DUF1707)